MRPKKPLDLNNESTGRLKRLPESKELMEIINKLETYFKNLNSTECGTLKIEEKKMEVKL